MTMQKVSISFDSLSQNSEKAWIKANKHFHAKLVKYSNLYSISANVWPILMKFGTAMYIRLQKLTCEKSFRILTISCYSLSQSSENKQNKHFHANCMKYWNFYDIFTY